MRRPTLGLATLLLAALVSVAGCQSTAPPAAPEAVTSQTAPPPQAMAHQDYMETIPGTAVSFQMTAIPGGTFVIGSPPDEPKRDDDEGPQRTVIVPPFWMSTHEVAYDAFTIFRFPERDADTTALAGYAYSADATTRPSPPYEDPGHGMGKDGFPAVGMTQWGALQYARWLYEKTGHFYRLPTEAEWEYACRAGTTTAYSFGDDPAALDAYAWHYGNSDEVYQPIGTKAPNPWGLYDMHGNVSEWTLDLYKPDRYATWPETVEAPWEVPESLHPRTVRGGAYDDDPDALRCANRLRSSLNWKRRDPQVPKSFWWNTDAPFVGFRLVRPVAEMTHEEIIDFYATVLGS